MKAAVLYQAGELPQYADFPAPIPQNENEIAVSVKAVAIKHIDKSIASGKHYSSDAPKENGRVTGGDGVCILPDGTRVYAVGASGMLAEKATIEKHMIVPVPEDLDDITAAALPNGVIGAAMALRFKANIQEGDTVLINGATGFTGRIAVQIAKHYGAKKVVATGRNLHSLQELLTLGADEIIPLTDDFHTRLTGPFDIIIDYLWGHTAEKILSTLKGKGKFTHHTRYVSVGSMAGETITLSSSILRSVDLQLSGSGLGAWSKYQVELLFSEILPEMFRLAASGHLKIATTAVKLEDISTLWDKDVSNGERLVVII
ncbi:quinone oxidoreductase family protein [Chitinophaga sancti]|uniref:NADPH:quinone reductase n=1 Tax=Chitinophaga sancti TaxID=1004 RepID=A0A1K1S6U6_9BACT|nr:zinc-binding alcohol dehydrogenase family protein [Chitinophaga sancti]WQD62182.1 zinc-binding alcohol dehydrogenase family protein [Chitinophaga sancti]WQG92249.1 zinc-binding alcohol dehydrogenase family protein [Chitinophaga sancti]SFW80046.1 NADPH:quinone reductase [Chitinophaga sancti]